jgi:hypothetical protein
MKSRSLLTLLLALFAVSCFADAGYARLFKSAGSSLSEQDQKSIYSLLGLSSSSGRGHVFEGCPPAEFKVKIVDLNNDGTPEVFVTGGNTCTSGITGNSVWLFTKAAGSTYNMQLGFPATEYKILQGGSEGYPDIRFGDRGFCEPVWRWDGREYSHFKNIPSSPGGCNDR